MNVKTPPLSMPICWRKASLFLIANFCRFCRAREEPHTLHFDVTFLASLFVSYESKECVFLGTQTGWKTFAKHSDHTENRNPPIIIREPSWNFCILYAVKTTLQTCHCGDVPSAVVCDKFKPASEQFKRPQTTWLQGRIFKKKSLRHSSSGP